MNLEEIKEENERRVALLAQRDRYDPSTGEGCCGPRTEVWLPGNHKRAFVPATMTKDPRYRHGMGRHAFDMLRMEHDFEYWCSVCVTVKDKNSYADIRLVLNRPQRLIVARLEEMRLNHQPIRAVLLKARQCGGSTVVQAYMAWIQLMMRDNCHSLICAHVKDAAATIRGMMSKIVRNYPSEYLPDGMKTLRLRPYENSRNVCRIEGRGNTITICSAENQDAVRGTDIALAHLSEVAFWRTSAGHDPNNIIRAVAGSVALTEYTLVVLESTANGTGNYFHDEWLRACAGESDKCAIFVPWYENPAYTCSPGDLAAFCERADDYERRLWHMGLTLGQIAWYRAKRREYVTHRAMQAEYPTTADEAFTATDRTAFDPEGVERLRQGCRPPIVCGDMAAHAVTGPESLERVAFVASETGRLKVWKRPMPGCRPCRYVTVVDVGGRSDASDYSVIAVIDSGEESGDKPEVVAQWRGHTDHDLLAWKAAQIAQWYGQAVLVIESNTLETGQTEGDNAAFILDELSDAYPRLYFRRSTDPATGKAVRHPGFHTNRRTKPLIVNRHIAAVRDGGYTERDMDAVNEHSVFERKENGTYGAREGFHDDILMTWCIGLYVIDEMRRHAGTSVTPLKRPRLSARRTVR